MAGGAGACGEMASAQERRSAGGAAHSLHSLRHLSGRQQGGAPDA